MSTQLETNTLSPEAAYVVESMERGFHLIPGHMRQGIKDYILHGYPPGGFLTALLRNDFMSAAGKADSENAAALIGWARFLYNHVPSGSYGSPEAVERWCVKCGYLGGEERAA